MCPGWDGRAAYQKKGLLNQLRKPLGVGYAATQVDCVSLESRAGCENAFSSHSHPKKAATDPKPGPPESVARAGRCHLPLPHEATCNRTLCGFPAENHWPPRPAAHSQSAL